MRIERFLVPVGQDVVIRVELRKERGRLIGFVCQLEADDGTNVVPVVRYDTSHGHLHIHKFWRAKDREPDPLEDADDVANDYTKQLDDALENLVENHARYLTRMKRGGKA